MVRVSHSNTILGLYILRNIYSKGISIKEIYSFLMCNDFIAQGKNESAKYVLVDFRIYVFCERAIVIDCDYCSWNYIKKDE